MSKTRNILITGTSRGLGKALAERYLASGDHVYGCSRSEKTIDADKYFHHRVDITSEADITGMFISIREQAGLLDAVINNAGIASMNAFALTPVKSFNKVFTTNVLGTFLCCQKALGLLRKAPHPRIINMTTVAVPFQLEGESIYASSKSAVETMTRILAKEYGDFGITCNAIGPSPIETDLIEGVAKNKIRELLNRQAVKKMATPDDVINVADFFLRPESGMISGQVVYLGGVS